MEDDDFIEFNEFILEMANVDFYLTEHFMDEEIILKPKQVHTETPVQLIVEVDENDEVRIGAIPPMYYVETTIMPVFHAVKLTIDTKDNGY